METLIEHTSEMTLLTLSGRFDAHTAPPVRDALAKLIAEKRQHILVDMANETFVDSTGFSVLVGGMKGCRKIGGDLALMHLRCP
jgi:anti-sigma B factor antagonist